MVKLLIKLPESDIQQLSGQTEIACYCADWMMQTTKCLLEFVQIAANLLQGKHLPRANRFAYRPTRYFEYALKKKFVLPRSAITYSRS